MADSISIVNKDTKASKKVNISLRELLDVDETGGNAVTSETAVADWIKPGQALFAYTDSNQTSLYGKVNKFRFKYLSSFVLAGTGITVTDNGDGTVTIDSTATGDMSTSVYDTDLDGIVDNAEAVKIIVRNSTGVTLTKGQVVYLSGATGNRPNAVLADASTEATSSKTIGLVSADIANNADGNVTVSGTMHDLDLSAFADGDRLWLKNAPGAMVATTPPAEPNHAVFIGTVARAHPTQGRIVLAIQNGYELDELHGVQITSVADNNLLQYDSASGLWKNESLSTAGIEPAISSGTTSQYWRGDKTWQSLPTSNGYVLAGNLNGGTVGLGVTTYIGFSVGSTNTIENQRRTVVSAGTVSGVYLRTVGTMTGSMAVTVMKNGVATSMTFTIAAGSAAGLYSTTSNTFTVVDGDELSIRIVQSTATSIGIVNYNIIVN